MSQQATNKRNLYLNVLRQAGRRITEPRRAICDYLAQTDKHPTPYQVFEELSAQYPEMSRATVYNTLNMLQELGAIVEIGFGADHTHYETDTSPHINLICLRCHDIVDYHPSDHHLGATGADVGDQSPNEQPATPATVDAHQVDAEAGDEALRLLQAMLADADGIIGFRAVAIRTDVYGFCDRCQSRKRAEIREQWLAQQGDRNKDLI